MRTKSAECPMAEESIQVEAVKSIAIIMGGGGLGGQDSQRVDTVLYSQEHEGCVIYTVPV